MSLREAVSNCIQKSFVFSGRSIRSEFWYFKLFFLLVFAVLALAEVSVYYFTVVDATLLYLIYLVLDGIVFLLFLVPNLAVDFRRLHDTDRSGATLLLGLIPVLGTIPLIIFFCEDSSFGCNHYGDNPKHQYRASDGSKIFESGPSEGANPYHQPWKDG